MSARVRWEPFTWRETPGESGIQAPVSFAEGEPYQISHRPLNYTASYHSARRHIGIGSFPTLAEAKAACEGFDRALDYEREP